MRLRFPAKGTHKRQALSEQPEGTSPDMNNVRPFDVLAKRLRGGQRPGMDKRYTQQIHAEFPIIAICSVTTVGI